MNRNDCMHDEHENLVCIDCGIAFDDIEDFRMAQREALAQSESLEARGQ